MMWYGILKEFNNCKVTSTWSRCGRAKRNSLYAQTTDNLGAKDKNARRSWITSLDQQGGTMKRTPTMRLSYGTHGIIARFSQGYTKGKVRNSFHQKKEELVRMEAEDRSTNN